MSLFNKEPSNVPPVMYTEEQLMARLKFFIGGMLEGSLLNKFICNSLLVLVKVLPKVVLLYLVEVPILDHDHL